MHLRDAEVQYFDQASVADDDIGGLEIAMDDSCGMRRGQRARELTHVIDDLFDGELRGESMQRLALDELHHQELGAVCFEDVVHRNDVGIVQRRCGSCLLEETLAAFQIAGNIAR
jgi:hypothetical protein